MKARQRAGSPCSPAISGAALRVFGLPDRGPRTTNPRAPNREPASREPATPISYSPPDAEPDGPVRARAAALVEARSDEGGVGARCVGRGAAGRGAPAERRLDVLQLVPVLARRRFRRSAARRHGLVDPARAAAAHRRRHADGRRDRAMGAGGRLGLPERRAERGDPGAPRTGAQRSRRGQRAPAGARVPVSLPRRERGQPDRAHANGACRRRRGRPPAFRRLRLQPLRDRLLHRLPAHRAGAVRLRHPHRRLHLRVARRWRQERRARAPAHRRRDLHAGRLPQPLRPVQVGSRTSSPRTARPPSS